MSIIAVQEKLPQSVIKVSRSSESLSFYQNQNTTAQNWKQFFLTLLVLFTFLSHNNNALLWNLYGPDRSGIYGRAQGIGGLEGTYTLANGTSTGIVNNYFGDALGSMSSGHFSAYNSDLGGYGPMPGSSVANNLTPQWRGHYLDGTGFYYMGARYYEPNSGRFLSADPLGHDASLSLYDYCGGDPINALDPDGRCVEGASAGWANGDGPFAGTYDSSQASSPFAYGTGWMVGGALGEFNAVIALPIFETAVGALQLANWGLNTAGQAVGLREDELAIAGFFIAPQMAMLNAMAEVGEVGALEKVNEVLKTPSALPSSSGYNPWVGSIDSLVTDNDTIMYRTWGGGASKVGAWLSPVKPTSTLSSIRNFALPIENSAEFFSEVLVPAGTRYQIGKAASAFGQPGGDTQVLLLDRISPANFGPTIPLAPWL